MPIHEPKFAPGVALYIIWRESPEGEIAAVAAGTVSAMLGAWDAIQGQHLRDELRLQQGARVMHRRGSRSLEDPQIESKGPPR